MLPRRRESDRGDEQVQGRGAFLARLRRAVESRRPGAGAGRPLATLIETVCQANGVVPAPLHGGERHGAVGRGREGKAYLWIKAWGRSGRQLAPTLGIRPQSAYAAAQHGREAATQWARMTARNKT